MSQPKVAQRSPIKIQEEPGTKFWCACGESKSQPYCDGSHKGTEFSPVKVELPEAKMVAWCGCKHSAKSPFCDGSHRELTVENNPAPNP